MKENNTQQSGSLTIIITGIVLVCVIALAIYGGMKLQQSHPKQAAYTPTNGSQSNSNSAGIANGYGDSSGSGNQRATGHGSITGTIQAVTSQSITIHASDGTSKTYAITSTTSISDAGTQSFGNASSGQLNTNDLTVGETVVVTPDRSNESQAIGILVNPR